MRNLALDLDADACAHGPSSLTDGKMHALFHRHRLDQLHRHLDVVSGHDHLHSLRQADRSRHIRGAHIELRPVPVEEGRMPPSLLLG